MKGKLYILTVETPGLNLVQPYILYYTFAQLDITIDNLKLYQHYKQPYGFI